MGASTTNPPITHFMRHQAGTGLLLASLFLLSLSGSEDGAFRADAFQFQSGARYPKFLRIHPWQKQRHDFGIQSTFPEELEDPQQPPPIIDIELPADDDASSDSGPSASNPEPKQPFPDLTISPEMDAGAPIPIKDPVLPERPPPIIDIELPADDASSDAEPSASNVEAKQPFPDLTSATKEIEDPIPLESPPPPIIDIQLPADDASNDPGPSESIGEAKQPFSDLTSGSDIDSSATKEIEDPMSLEPLPPIIDIQLPADDASNDPGQSESTGEEKQSFPDYPSTPEIDASAPNEMDDPPDTTDNLEIDPQTSISEESAPAVPEANLVPDDPLSSGRESQSLINGDVGSSPIAQNVANSPLSEKPLVPYSSSSGATKNQPVSSTFRSSGGSDISFEAKAELDGPKRQRFVKMAEAKKPAPSTFQSSGGSDIAFEAKAELEPPRKQRIVKMAEAKEPASSTFQSSGGSDISFEAKAELEPPRKQRIVKMAEAKEPAPSTFQSSGGSDISFEAKAELEPPRKQRIVKMAEAKKPAPSTFQSSAGSDISFEAKAELEPPRKQRIVKMAEAREPAPSTFQSTGNDMSFEPKIQIRNAKKETAQSTMFQIRSTGSASSETPSKTFQGRKKTVEKTAPRTTMFQSRSGGNGKLESSRVPPAKKTTSFEADPDVRPPTTRRIVQTAEKEEPETSSFESKNSDMSYEAKPEILPPTTQRVVKMAEKVEPAPSTFKSAGSEMSFEPKPEILPPKTQRVVKMAEKVEPAPSTFKSAGSGMSFEAKPLPSDTSKKQRIIQMAEKKEPVPSTFQKSGSGLSYEAKPLTLPKQKFVKTTETNDARPSTFRAGANGQMFDDVGTIKKQSPARRSTMFQAAPVTESKPPQSTMFRAAPVEKESKPPQPTMFEAAEAEEDSQPSPSTIIEKAQQQQSKIVKPKASVDIQPEVSNTPPKKDIAEKSSRQARTSTFRHESSGMMFEAAVVKPPSPPAGSTMFKATTVKKRTSPTMTNMEQTAPKIVPKIQGQKKTPQHPDEIEEIAPPGPKPTPEKSDQNVVPDESNDIASAETEKEAPPPPPKAFRSEDTGISFEVKSVQATNKRIVRMMEKKEAPPSKVFRSEDNGMMFEARRQPAPKSNDGGTMFEAGTTEPVKKKRPSFRNIVKSTGTAIGTMFRAQISTPPPSIKDEETLLVEETRATEKARVAEKMRLAEEVRIKEEEARLREEVQLEKAEEARIAEEIKLVEEKRLAEEMESSNPKVLDGKNTGISFEVKQPPPTQQRIVKMAEKKEPATSTFKSTGSGMSFEPQLKESNKPPTKQRIVKMAEKKEPASSTFKSAGSGMSFEPRLNEASKPPTKQRIVKMAEKKEPAPSTFKSAGSGMSFEPRLNEASKPIQRVQKAVERKEASSSKSSQDTGDSIAVEAESSKYSTPEPQVTAASSPGLFQRKEKNQTFKSDGSQFVHQSPKEKRLFLAKKVAAQMFTTEEKTSTVFENDGIGMNMVVTNRPAKRPPAATTKGPALPLNPGEDPASESRPRNLPSNLEDGGMKMVSFVANDVGKQSASAFQSIQKSKLDVNSAKMTADGIQTFAKFVSDGLQMVYEESQKKAVVTPEEAKRQKKERNRKKIFGFEIGPSEEELASQMMEEGKHLAIEGGKQFAKFASDGLQMVYHAAEKQTKDYIDSNKLMTTKKESSATTEETSKDSIIEPHTPAPFFTTNESANTDDTVKHKPSTVSENASKPFFAASHGDQEANTRRTTADADGKNKHKHKTAAKFAATNESYSENKIPTKGTTSIDDKSLHTPASTSSLLKSGGRMFVKFVGDGLQMVQRVASQNEKRYRRPPK